MPGAEFSWWSVVPTMVGAAMSILTTLAMFSLAQWTDRKKKEADKRKEGAIIAFEGFLKLKAVSEELGNQKRQIDEAFDEAREKGDTLKSPSKFVRGFVSAASGLQSLDAKQLVFLVKIKKAELMVDAELIVRRAQNVEASIRKYTELRDELQQFLSSNAEVISTGGDPRGQFGFSGKNAELAKIKVAALDELVLQIRAFLDKDAPESRRVADAYLSAARQHFGDDFPQFKLEWVDD